MSVLVSPEDHQNSYIVDIQLRAPSHREFFPFGESARVHDWTAWLGIGAALVITAAIVGAANRNQIVFGDAIERIRPIRIVEPSGTAVWRLGQEYAISWNVRPAGNEAASITGTLALYRIRIAAYPASACTPRATGGFRCNQSQRQAILDDGYVQASNGEYVWTVPQQWGGLPLAEGAYVLELMLAHQDGTPFATDRKAFMISNAH